MLTYKINTMKKINIIILAGIVISILSLNSCKKDSFLDRSPVSSITVENFFNNANDLATYTNELYGASGVNTPILGIGAIAGNDFQSDNMESIPVNKIVANELSVPATGSSSEGIGAGWNWSFLRQVNYFLENYQKADAPVAVKNHYAGVAKFFRAWFYFNMVKSFGAVPWYGTPIQPTDNGDLYAPRGTRELVMDSVMADLNYAVKNINPPAAISGTVTKWTALALLARVGLHEGTFREYQGISGSQPFLQTADSAALAIMQSGNFKLYSTGNPDQDYQNLFLFYTPTDPQNTEVILGSYYSSALNTYSSVDATVASDGLGLTQEFMNNYLMSNGTPFTSIPGYDTMMIKNVFTNRDPRLSQTCLPPTTLAYGTMVGPRRLGPSPTGYQQVKWYDPAGSFSYGTNTNAGIVFRYGETLLIYAEAKAELTNMGVGTFSQADLDISINLLRTRVGMPLLVMNVPIDPVLAAEYSNISAGPVKNVLLEIRRERRVELACEGFRYDDLMRWKAGSLMAKQFLGMYFPGLGLFDLNGDGTPDVALVTSLPANPIANVSYFVVGTDITLTHGTYGNVLEYPSLVRTFISPKNYYLPLPTQELLLNKNLTQNPGW